MDKILVSHVTKEFTDASGKPFTALNDVSFEWNKD